ncbi:MAG: hypothetical protein Q9213_002577 [Squamulea squamosa]
MIIENSANSDDLQRNVSDRQGLMSEASDEELSDEDESDMERTYCYCNQGIDGLMMACEMETCTRQWFHFRCVGLTGPPKGNSKSERHSYGIIKGRAWLTEYVVVSWVCDDCKAKPKEGTTPVQGHLSRSSSAYVDRQTQTLDIDEDDNTYPHGDGAFALKILKSNLGACLKKAYPAATDELMKPGPVGGGADSISTWLKYRALHPTVELKKALDDLQGRLEGKNAWEMQGICRWTDHPAA